MPADCETLPDTYVKCYMKDGDRLRQKKKTRVIRHSAEPVYQQSLKYQVSALPANAHPTFECSHSSCH